MTREQELAAAIDRADLPPRDKEIWRQLFRRADWKTAVIPKRWQPKSLRDIARDAHMGVATVCRGLNHLESHGWIERHRTSPGRGHPTAYGLMAGADCDCLTLDGSKTEPVSDAERMRHYRARKKASHPGVTHGEKASQFDVTPGGKASQNDVTKRLSVRNDAAGQGHFSGKEGVERGKVERETEAQVIPIFQIAAVRLVPYDDDERNLQAALKTLTGVLGPVELVPHERARETAATCLACSAPARRSCRTCWTHARLELSA